MQIRRPKRDPTPPRSRPQTLVDQSSVLKGLEERCVLQAGAISDLKRSKVKDDKEKIELQRAAQKHRNELQVECQKLKETEATLRKVGNQRASKNKENAELTKKIENMHKELLQAQATIASQKQTIESKKEERKNKENTELTEKIQDMHKQLKQAEAIIALQKETIELQKEERTSIQAMYDAQQQNLSLGINGECVVCMEKQATYLFTACGHMSLCESCTKVIDLKQPCPVCFAYFDGSTVQPWIKLFQC